MDNKNLKLFLVSFLMLFLEIFLIRWISTEIKIFAYVNNLVLLACFLGIGIGCYYSKRQTNVSISFIMLFLLSLVIQLDFFKGITYKITRFSGYPLLDRFFLANYLITELGGAGLTFIIFSMILITFIPLGQILGKLLDEHKNIILGYSVNIGASLLGIWFFNLCSFFYTPPWVWFIVSLAFLLFFVRWTRINRIIAVSCSILILFFSSLNSWYRHSLLTLWSPYQKIDIYRNIREYKEYIENGFVLKVNNIGYMALLDLSDRFFKEHIQGFEDLIEKEYNQYELPYYFTAEKKDILIVGAGGGNDVAGALRSGAENIDAVEIDPGIYMIGISMHPEGPYQEQNVNMFIDDARAFFRKGGNGNKKYDIICFGLLDAHTLSSNYNNMRIDHYVYTKEAFQEAKRLLKDNGVLSVIFGVGRRWQGDRIYGLLNNVFGEVPYIVKVHTPDERYGWGGTIFITGRNPEKLKENAGSDRPLMDYINRNSMKSEFTGVTKVSTDDWPYLYLEKPGIPRPYLLIIGTIIALLFIINKLIMKSAPGKINMHFFFLGCAFLLLEFQNVSKSALLFGSTWIANSYIISAILVLILLSNLFVYHFKIKNYKVFYYLLLASIIVVYLVPLEVFNVFKYWPKVILASVFLNIPIFFAGVIFINSFRNAVSKNIALGSNLIGAAAGGLLETLSFIFGIKALLILVFLSYTASLFCLKEVK